MQEKIRQLLKAVYDQHGAKIFDDRSRMTGILSDQCGGLNKEIKIIGVCIGLRIPGEIMQMKDHVIEERDYRRWLNQLIDGEGMHESLSAWAIEVLAETLGKKISAEAPKAQVNIRKKNALSADIRSGKEFDPDKPVPDLSRDAFETPEEYKARIESSGWLLCGHALLAKNDYNVESGEWNFKMIWQDWAKAISEASIFTDIIQIQRDEAKQIFSIHQTSGDQARIPLYCQIEVREKFVYFSKLILKTRETDYPIFRIEKTFKDTRDGKTYKVVKIGDQIWLAENLNYDVGNGCWFYDNNPQNGEKYGRLYTMETAKRVAPPGWHLPFKEEFEVLLENLGREEEYTYKQLIPGGKSGFDALFGGCRGSNGYFYSMGAYANFWSSSESDTGNAWNLSVNCNNQKANMYNYYRGYAFSVRCIRD